MKHLTEAYKAYNRYSGPEAPREVPSRVKKVVEGLQSKVATLPEGQRAEFQSRIDDIVSHAQDKDMQNKLKAVGVDAAKAVAGMAAGTLLGPVGGVVSSAVSQYYATEFENASKNDKGVILPAEKVAGRRRAKRSSPQTSPSPTTEAAKTAAKSTMSAAVGGVGGIARGIWAGVKSLWGG